MIFLVLSSAQAQHVAERLDDPDLYDALCQQLRMEALCPTEDADVPELVMFRSVNGTLCLSAITYFDAAAADRAEGKFWQRVQAEAAAPVKRRKSA